MYKILLLSQDVLKLSLHALACFCLSVLVRLAPDAHDGEKGQLGLGPARLGVEELASRRRLARLVQALFESDVAHVLVLLASVITDVVPVATLRELFLDEHRRVVGVVEKYGEGAAAVAFRDVSLARSGLQPSPTLESAILSDGGVDKLLDPVDHLDAV